MTAIDAQTLRRRLTGTAELALIDVREEGAFATEHILLACCVPLSHLEFRIRTLVPRLPTPIVVTDGGPKDGLASRAAARLEEIGYSDIAVLTGGTAGWRAEGFEVFSGVNVPSKAFGEFVEHTYDTPRIEAAELKRLQDEGADLVVLDSRPPAEFRRMSIPDGIDCPGAELVYRAGTVAPDPSTTVVVNCAGRTRSIIGAQSLINAGLPNPVMALKNGTMGWELAGFELDRGREGHAPAPDGEALAAARARAGEVAKRFGVSFAAPADLARWQAEAGRTTVLFDVRTAEEFAAGHWPGARHAPGGQLVQATDEYVGVRHARIVLTDEPDGVRATMTASWLVQMGWPEVHVLAARPASPESGAAAPEAVLFQPFETLTINECQAVLDSGEPAELVDLADSLTYRRGHIPRAFWGVRARLPESIVQLAHAGLILLTSPDGRLAHYAAHELRAARPDLMIRVLDGGTAAWRAAGWQLAAGMERPLTTVDDVWRKPYDNEAEVRQAMEDYLTWELGLVEQVERDGLISFRRF